MILKKFVVSFLNLKLSRGEGGVFHKPQRIGLNLLQLLSLACDAGANLLANLGR